MRTALSILGLAFCALLEVSGRNVEHQQHHHDPREHPHEGYDHRTCSGGDSCCNRNNPCYDGEGDCDDDEDCRGSLVCGENNCHGRGFDGTDDCCEEPWARCDGGDSCCTHGWPCGVGEGDCDSDSDCSGWLVCGTNNCGRRRGFDSSDDCCRERCYGGDSCCSSNYQCDIGEGDCDHDSDCAGNLLCGSNNCKGRGFDNTDDCCFDPYVNKYYGNKYEDGADESCTEKAKDGGYCIEGEGDCDHDRECYGELVCGKDNCIDIHGRQSSYDSSDDCCEAPWNIYHTRQMADRNEGKQL